MAATAGSPNTFGVNTPAAWPTGQGEDAELNLMVVLQSEVGGRYGPKTAAEVVETVTLAIRAARAADADAVERALKWITDRTQARLDLEREKRSRTPKTPEATAPEAPEAPEVPTEPAEAPEEAKVEVEMPF